MPQTQASLSSTQTIAHATDSIVIVDVVDTLRGGRTIDTSKIKSNIVRAGHIIIKESATGNIQALATSEGQYVALPKGHEYIGFLVSSITTTNPQGSVLIHGTINHKASPYPLDDERLQALKTACPHILFVAD